LEFILKLLDNASRDNDTKFALLLLTEHLVQKLDTVVCYSKLHLLYIRIDTVPNYILYFHE